MPSRQKPERRAKPQKIRAAFRVLDAVRTVRGEGVIKFVFTQGRDGMAVYAVNFSNKRLGVIFHEHELAPGAGR